MRRKLGSLGITALSAGVAGTAAAVLFITLSGGPALATGASRQHALRLASGKALSGHSSAQLRAEYPRLRVLLSSAHTTSSSAVPDSVEQAVGSEFGLAQGESLSAAATAAAALPSEEVQVGSAGAFWITDDDGVLCGNIPVTFPVPGSSAIGQGAPGGCQSASQVATNGFVEMTGAGSANGNVYSAWGLVPSGDSTVSVNFGPDTSAQTVPVEDGAFLATFATRPESVTFPGSDSSLVKVR